MDIENFMNGHFPGRWLPKSRNDIVWAIEAAIAQDRKERGDVVQRLKSALVGLVGASEKEELEHMEAAIRILPVPEQDRANTINAIHALLALEAAEEEES